MAFFAYTHKDYGKKCKDIEHRSPGELGFVIVVNETDIRKVQVCSIEYI